MHSRDARRHGEAEQRLYLPDAWQESSLYSSRKHAALAWTEAVTRIAETHAPDAVYEEVRRHFDEQALGDLTVLIGMINLWNRLRIVFRSQYPADEKRAA